MPTLTVAQRFCGPPGTANGGYLAGRLAATELWAGTFRPTAELPSSGGAAAPETVWAALDCPSFQPVAPLNPAPHLLGTITARQDFAVRLDTDHVVLSWVIGREGRRATTASALIGPGGEVCARARAIWFEVPPGP